MPKYTFKPLARVHNEWIQFDWDYESEDDPCIIAEVSEQLEARIRQLQKAVVELGVYSIDEFDYTVDWSTLTIDGDPVRADCQTLVVTERHFKWVAYLKNDSTELSTDPIYISDLKE